MHGAVLLDGADKALRPAILWNDGRSFAECVELERRAPNLRQRAGNIAMPGFTAPKLLWVARHEPEVFKATKRVLLPKDYVRLILSGEHVSEMSDASGTLWLDVAARRWDDDLLAATGLSLRAGTVLLRQGERRRPFVIVVGGIAEVWRDGQPIDEIGRSHRSDTRARILYPAPTTTETCWCCAAPP